MGTIKVNCGDRHTRFFEKQSSGHDIKSIPPIYPSLEEAIKIAATQTKSAYADWLITGVGNLDLDG
jgi:hypothetical protein